MIDVINDETGERIRSFSSNIPDGFRPVTEDDPVEADPQPPADLAGSPRRTAASTRKTAVQQGDQPPVTRDEALAAQQAEKAAQADTSASAPTKE